jgi:hypothetical protein
MAAPSGFPLLSPRERRTFLRESDETSGQLSIEEYLHRSDPYRSTTIKDPWPLPLQEERASVELIVRIERLHPPILQILQDHSFPSADFLRICVQDITKPEYPSGNGNSPKTVVRLIYVSAPTPSHDLNPARDQISHLLRQSGLVLGVEIVFLDQCFRPQLFAITANDPAMNAYQTAEPRILELLKSTLGNKWCFLSLLNVGTVKEESAPSIVVFVDPLTVTDWSSLEKHIHMSLPVSSTSTINVEFLPGRVGLLPDPGRSMIAQMQDDGVPQPGTSIGVLPELGGGSLGPFVDLRYNGSVEKCALTNYHVVAPPSNAGTETIEKADKHGSSLLQEDETCTKVSFFAKKDIDATALAIDRELEAAKAQLHAAKEEKEMRQLAGDRISQRVNAIVDSASRLIESLERKKKVVETMPLRLGQTCLSSGKALHDGGTKVADWAVIKLDTSLFTRIEARVNRMPFIPPVHRANRYETGQVSVVNEGTVLEKFGKLEPHKWFCKTGRTTGITSGVCIGLHAQIPWDESRRTRFNARGESIKTTEGVTREWIIISETKTSRGTEQGQFCSSGDSGSSIISNDGLVCGLLYGEATALAGMRSDSSCGLCMTMPDVLHWVQEKTAPRDESGNILGPGASLELPSIPD